LNQYIFVMELPFSHMANSKVADTWVNNVDFSVHNGTASKWVVELLLSNIANIKPQIAPMFSMFLNIIPIDSFLSKNAAL
jgi:hypothetical protein